MFNPISMSKDGVGNMTIRGRLHRSWRLLVWLSVVAVAANAEVPVRASGSASNVSNPPGYSSANAAQILDASRHPVALDTIYSWCYGGTAPGSPATIGGAEKTEWFTFHIADRTTMRQIGIFLVTSPGGAADVDLYRLDQGGHLVKVPRVLNPNRTAWYYRGSAGRYYVRVSSVNSVRALYRITMAAWRGGMF
jgi:hypothetical protein